MRIAIVGVGCIGSVVAAHLAQAGHDITLVARGHRRASLATQGLRVRGNGAQEEQVLRLPVVESVADAPNAELVFVTVQMPQVEAILPALVRHPARHICLLLNVHPLPASWTKALRERLILGFPSMLAGFRDDLVQYRTLPAWLRFAIITSLGPARGADAGPALEVAALLRASGLAADVHQDMESWLASHSALVVPLMAHASRCCLAGRSLQMSWEEAHCVARALKEALGLAQRAGATLTPANVAALPYVPSHATAATLWSLSRLPWFERAVFDYVEHAEHEVRAMYQGLRDGAGGTAAPNLDRLCTSREPEKAHLEVSEGALS